MCEYLSAHGHPYAERRAMSGSRDRGDIAGVPGWVLECKAHASIDLASAVDEATTEQANDGASGLPPSSSADDAVRLTPTSS